MARYRYRLMEDVRQGSVAVEIHENQRLAASARLVVASRDFDAYCVQPSFRDRGLSYALSLLMLLYCKDNRLGLPMVSNARGTLLSSLPKIGFALEGPVRPSKDGSGRLGTFACISTDQSLALCKKRLIVFGVLQDGMRNDGPYRWKL